MRPPETWIPYQLINDANVSISIYDITGKLVRKLELGNKPAGFYTSRGKTAHWNGQNEVGESTSSGVYLYTIKVGNFLSTRKMLLLK